MLIVNDFNWSSSNVDNSIASDLLKTKKNFFSNGITSNEYKKKLSIFFSSCNKRLKKNELEGCLIKVISDYKDIFGRLDLKLFLKKRASLLASLHRQKSISSPLRSYFFLCAYHHDQDCLDFLAQDIEGLGVRPRVYFNYIRRNTRDFKKAYKELEAISTQNPLRLMSLIYFHLDRFQIDKASKYIYKFLGTELQEQTRYRAISAHMMGLASLNGNLEFPRLSTENLISLFSELNIESDLSLKKALVVETLISSISEGKKQLAKEVLEVGKQLLEMTPSITPHTTEYLLEAFVRGQGEPTISRFDLQFLNEDISSIPPSKMGYYINLRRIEELKALKKNEK